MTGVDIEGHTLINIRRMEVKSLDKLDFFFIQKTHVQAYNAM